MEILVYRDPCLSHLYLILYLILMETSVRGRMSRRLLMTVTGTDQIYRYCRYRDAHYQYTDYIREIIVAAQAFFQVQIWKMRQG